MITRIAAAAVLASFALLPPATAAIVEITWTPEARFTHRDVVPAGKFLEVCGRLAAGTRVAWAFEAAGPTEFNIHYHQGEQVVYPARLSQTSRAADTLSATVAQDYCWMWVNKSDRASAIRLDLVRSP